MCWYDTVGILVRQASWLVGVQVRAMYVIVSIFDTPLCIQRQHTHSLPRAQGLIDMGSDRPTRQSEQSDGLGRARPGYLQPIVCHLHFGD
jgi:hypothetical protein